MLIATLTAICAVCIADITQPIHLQTKLSEAKDAGNTPHLVQKVRSPLGKEIDELGQKLVDFRFDCHIADVQIYDVLTNLAARVDKLEAVEAKRMAAREAAHKRKEERKTKQDERPTLQSIIRRGKKAANKEGK